MRGDELESTSRATLTGLATTGGDADAIEAPATMEAVAAAAGEGAGSEGSVGDGTPAGNAALAVEAAPAVDAEAVSALGSPCA